MEKFASYILPIDEELLKDSENIQIARDKISVRLLKYLLSDDHYDEMMNIYNKKYNRLNFYAKGKTTRTHSYSLSGLSQAFLILQTMKVSSIEQERIKMLTSINSFDKFIEDEKNNASSYEIDGKTFSISHREIIDFLMLDDESYKKALKRKYFKDGVLMEYALYIINNINRRFLEKYVFPPFIITRLHDIYYSRDVDIEALNQFSETKSCWLPKTNLDPLFEKEILEAIPSDLNLSEKIIFLYILLCQIFTYDPYYFAYEEDAPCNAKHKSINYLRMINKKNNRIVCYEFTNIFGYFLNKLGVHFEVFSEEEYYQYHSSVVFRVENFLVSADPVTSVLSGDLTRAKLGLPLSGLHVANQNKKTQKEFKEMVDKVYDLFDSKKVEISTRGYNATIINRVKEIVKCANHFPLDIMDKFSFIYLYKKMFFTNFELENLSYVILRDNIRDALIGVFTITVDGDYKYYIYEYNCEMREISVEELKSLMNNEEWSYVYNSIEKIPFKESKCKRKGQL